jgi:hypothetical protein
MSDTVSDIAPASSFDEWKQRVDTYLKRCFAAQSPAESNKEWDALRFFADLQLPEDAFPATAELARPAAAKCFIEARIQYYKNEQRA